MTSQAKEVQMERSLFERLQQAGCPVKMLSVQYRMHPSIREFPSMHFYNNRLQDAACIASMPEADFYSHPLLKPYIVFDVARGVHQKAAKSIENQLEADLAVALFWELRCAMVERYEAARASGGRLPNGVQVGLGIGLALIACRQGPSGIACVT